jgi:hypothetical protein
MIVFTKYWTWFSGIAASAEWLTNRIADMATMYLCIKKPPTAFFCD